MIPEQIYPCSYCGNEYRISEGYNPETKQCAGCDDWDRRKPERDAEAQWRASFSGISNGINFQYVAGDPFW